jgi:signal recognition particle subunit SRP54
MIPGVSGKILKTLNLDPRRFKRLEAIILSMTPEERTQPKIINASRRRRIALGSGVTVRDVNQLLNQFNQMRKMMKQMGLFSAHKGPGFSGNGIGTLFN